MQAAAILCLCECLILIVFENNLTGGQVLHFRFESAVL